MANFISSGKLPEEFNSQQRKKLIYDSKHYLWDEPYLWKLCSDGMIRRCVNEEKMGSIEQHCHGIINGGHFGPQLMCTNPQAYRIVSSSKERYRPTEILCLTTVILIVFCLFRQ